MIAALVAVEDVFVDAKVGGLLTKYVLPAEDMFFAMWDLSHMNIHEATLFPDLDGVARYIREEFLLKKLSDLDVVKVLLASGAEASAGTAGEPSK